MEYIKNFMYMKGFLKSKRSLQCRVEGNVLERDFPPMCKVNITSRILNECVWLSNHTFYIYDFILVDIIL